MCRCVAVCGHVYMRAGTHRVQKTVWGPLEGELQATVNCWMWVLGTRLGSFARVA